MTSRNFLAAGAPLTALVSFPDLPQCEQALIQGVAGGCGRGGARDSAPYYHTNHRGGRGSERTALLAPVQIVEAVCYTVIKALRR